MKNTLNNGSAVQASNSLGANGGILGAAVAQWQKVQDIKITKGLIDYKHNLNLDRDTHRTAMGIAADQARLSTAHNFNMVRDAAAAKSKLDVVKEGGRQKRITTTHTNKSGVKTMKDMTVGLETTAGLPLSGGISALVASPGQFQGQLQALKGHPHLGIKPGAANANSGTGNGNAGTTTGTPNTATPKTNTRAKKAKTAPMFAPTGSADPSKSNVKPVAATVANPFSAVGQTPDASVQPSVVTAPKITKPRVTKTQKAEG
jgi:hypothetical protein